jgi:hypothetical protein
VVPGRDRAARRPDPSGRGANSATLDDHGSAVTTTTTGRDRRRRGRRGSRPGVVACRATARVLDAIRAAGGAAAVPTSSGSTSRPSSATARG